MTTTEFAIRPAILEDLPAILTIFNDAILHSTAVYSYSPYTPKMMKEWFKEKESQNLPVFVATQKNSVTGFVTYGKFRARPAYKYTMEHSIYVHPDYRRQGIAKTLMEHIILVATKNNVHALIGGIDAENTVSIEFHKKFGFKQAGILKEVGFKFDRWLDLIFMQKILSTPQNASS